MAHTTDGLTFDARDRLYFKRALTASSTVAILLVDKTDNTPINVYVSPIVHKGKVLGALFATVQTDAFIMSIDDRLFNGSGQVLVTNNQGHILFRGSVTMARPTTWRTASWKSPLRTGTSFPSSRRIR